MNLEIDKHVENKINQAVFLLKQGELVVFPTETVYGLGADATNELAIQRIYEIKKRPRNHPLIVHIANIDNIQDWAVNLTPMAWRLAKAFWPGPLTLILKRAPHVLPSITGGQDTIALRIPSHPVAQRLLQIFNGGIAAPSANYFGRLSPTQASHVYKELGADVKLIIDGGLCQCGLESTIVEVTTDAPNILRLGAIGIDSIAEVLGGKVFTSPTTSKIAAPGTLVAHYAPRTRMYLISSNNLKDFVAQLCQGDKTIAVLARQPAFSHHSSLQWIVMSNTPSAYAYELYACLHEVDEENYEAIVVEMVPEEDSWLAIRDRLIKAERGSQNPE